MPPVYVGLTLTLLITPVGSGVVSVPVSGAVTSGVGVGVGDGDGVTGVGDGVVDDDGRVDVLGVGVGLGAGGLVSEKTPFIRCPGGRVAPLTVLSSLNLIIAVPAAIA